MEVMYYMDLGWEPVVIKMTDPREDRLPAKADDDRRKFLASCGKFAAITPPAITMLLSTSLNSEAIAHSGGAGGYPRGNNGKGNGGGDGSPNGKPDGDR
jgi:hypothetical protein